MESICISLKATATASPVNISQGRSNGGTVFWGETIRGGRDFGTQLWKSLRAENGIKKAKPGVAYSIITPEINKETMKFETPKFEAPQADPKNVASIILGGGAGTRLFPLTSQRAKPAVPIGGCYRLIDIPMSNCINSGIKKIFILTQFNSFSLNRHLARTYNFGNGVNFGDGFVEVLAATQTPGEAGKKWFQGTADAVRQFVWVFEKHIDSNADITVSCLPMDDSRAPDYGLMKIDGTGRIVQFAEKPKGPNLKTMQVDTSILGLSAQDAARYPYIASMGVYVFKTSVLLKLLTRSYPSCNDFGSEIIPSAAYLFNDYWEDIGTIKSFFDANLALTEQPPKFEFYDPKTPFYTSPRFLPPTKVDECKIVDSIISHGCFLRECSVQHSIVGVRSRLESGVDLQDTMMMGADYYQTESEIASLLAEGKVPIGVGQNTKIKNCIIDKNARIGKDVIISNTDVSVTLLASINVECSLDNFNLLSSAQAVEEAERPEDGFYIRSGITVTMKNATIRDGTVI
ncbi:ADP-glucose pyrophosphorylase small subunit ADPGp-2 [Gossypium australe]|uniref:glucose-1-phosphate adenylyltransferase n=1 Tax=Gossypium australe TaxID=47621 RepID=A0A5B6X8D9_9ROSI|nr:ADP-glucose pyrophosphorylase small subunit ADPGp-2 [Gossypium australe]